MHDTVSVRTPRLVIAIATVVLALTPVLVFPYLTLDRTSSRIDVESTALWWLLVVHVLSAAVALILGVAQFVPRIRRRRAIHRWNGRLFLAAGVVAFGFTGIPLALSTPNGDITRFGVLIPAVAWLVTAGLGLRAARQHRFADHRAWMIRTYALTFFAVTARIVVPLLLLVQLPFRSGADMEAVVEATIPVGQWLGWIINLVVAEIVIRRTWSTQPKAPSQPQAALSRQR